MTSRKTTNITHGYFHPEKTAPHITEGARKAVAARALGPDDCVLLLDILGLRPLSATPQSSLCLRCGKKHARNGTGRTSYFCSKRCYSETLKEERQVRSRNVDSPDHIEPDVDGRRVS